MTSCLLGHFVPQLDHHHDLLEYRWLAIYTLNICEVSTRYHRPKPSGNVDMAARYLARGGNQCEDLTATKMLQYTSEGTAHAILRYTRALGNT